jgi:ankyrin repeat protein
MIAADGGPTLPHSADYAAALLGKGAKKDAVDDRGRTALARATEEKNTAVIDLLKK